MRPRDAEHPFGQQQRDDQARQHGQQRNEACSHAERAYPLAQQIPSVAGCCCLVCDIALQDSRTVIIRSVLALVDELVLRDPRHHRAQLRADLFDRVRRVQAPVGPSSTDSLPHPRR